MRRRLRWPAWLAVLGAAPAMAQVAPGAGAVLRQLQPAQDSVLPAPKVAPDERRERAAAPTGPALHVTRFRFEGNRLIDGARLAALVRAFDDRDLRPADLREVTDAVAREYRRRGWLARVYVPPQKVEHGVVLLRVVEGRFGQVRFSDDTDVQALRVQPGRIEARAQHGLQPGQPVSLPALQRGLLLAGDLPGVTVTGSEEPGAQEGLTDVVLQAQNEPLVTGEVSFDNYGQAGVGSERAVGHLDINSPLGLGEQFDLTGIATPDLQYGRGAVSLPLGDDGLRMAVDAAGLHYAVAVPEYRGLRPQGDTTVFGGTLEYQWLRSTRHNLTIGLDMQRKDFQNAELGVTINRYPIYDAALYLSGNLYDDLLGGATSTIDVSFGHGWVAMSGSPGQYWDRINADTQGQFNVLRYRLGRTQQLPADFSLAIAFSGQLSYQNLDPAEMFYPGGPVGVGSSAVAADGGSSGQMANVELRWARLHFAGVRCTLKLRYDVAHVRIYANDQWAAAPQPNSYFLQGVGAGTELDGPRDLHLSVMAEHRVGGDAGAEVPDSGLTGARRDTRVWASLEKRF